MLSSDGRECSGCVSSTRCGRAVEVIERNAEAQIRLIEDVLDVSRIMTGKMALSMESLNIREVLGATIDAVRPATQAKGVRLDAHLDHDVADVCADPHRLQQVFGNVLSNAVKFTRVGDVITVTLRSANGWGRDSGCRYRCRDSTRRAAVRVRSLPSGRLVDDARPRRAGSRSRHRSAHRRAPRRNRGSGQPGGGAGSDVHDSVTARSRYPRFDAD